MKDQIKVGCNVLIKARNGAKLAKVSRETKTLWVVEIKNISLSGYREEKYRKCDLMECGAERFHKSSIEFISDDNKEKLEKRWAMDRRKRGVQFNISEMNALLISDSDLEKYEALIDNYHRE